MADPGVPRKRFITRLRRRSPLSLALIATLLLLVAAAAASENWAFFESSGEDRLVVPDTPFPLAYVAMAAMAVLLVCALALRIGDSRPRPERRRRSSLRPLAFALALVALWALLPPLQQFASQVLGDDEGGRATPEERRADEQKRDGDEGPKVEPSRPLGWAVIIAFILATIAVVAAMIVLLRQKPTPLPPRRRAPPELIKEIEASEADLRTIEDPRAAVIACYSRMQKAVSGAGVARRESDTPFELLERLALDGRIRPAAARRLTELFETAKFSLRPVDESMRMQALGCLGDIRRSLEEVAA